MASVCARPRACDAVRRADPDAAGAMVVESVVTDERPKGDDKRREEIAAAEAVLAERERAVAEEDRQRKLRSRLGVLKAVQRTGWWWPGEDD